MLTQGLVNTLFEYKDGRLYHKTRPSQRTAQGSEAGCLHHSGYKRVKIKNKGYAVHRIVFLIHHGYMPLGIDHINGVKDDNRIENLRAANQSQNSCNRRLAVSNTTGAKGVYWREDSKKWRVIITKDGKSVNIGCFSDYQSAVDASLKARDNIHGEFANHG